MTKGIRINKSKIVHLYYPGTDRTDCGAGGMDSVSVNGGIATDDAVTCKRCLKAIAAEVERAHAEALEMDEQRTIARAYLSTSSTVVLTWEEIRQANRAREEENESLYDSCAARTMDGELEPPSAHLLGWCASDGSPRTCDVVVEADGVLLDGAHEGPCYDALAEEWREEARPTTRQRKAARRAGRAKLRRTAPETRAAGRARRVRRGTARATAKTLLVAAGVPQDVAQRYAPAFSRGVQAPTVRERIRTGAHRSKRVDVKRYSWAQFAERLEAYRPACVLPFTPDSEAFADARRRVLA